MIKFIFKPQAPFDNIQKNAENPNVCFMRSIIMQAILDYTATCNPNLKLFNWFFKPNKHFTYICNAAHLKVKDVRKEIRQIIKFVKNKKMK